MQQHLPLPQPSQYGQPRRIGDVLAELLSQYQSRFPNVGVAILEAPAIPAGRTGRSLPAQALPPAAQIRRNEGLRSICR
jgi:hypothetical protein